MDVATENGAMSSPEEQGWAFPLLLSFLAGGSTCIGAAVVFVWNADQIQQSMSFSLSLAASVMITVSVISIGPECFEGILRYEPDGAILADPPIDWSLLWERLVSFSLGCLAYYLLSKVLVLLPDPENFLAKSEERDENSKNTPTLTNDEEEGLLSDVHSGCNKTGPAKSSPQPRKNIRRNINNSRDAAALTSTPSQESGNDDGDVELPVLNKEDDGHAVKGMIKDDSHRKRSWRVAMLLFVSLLCHNFPEGLAVVASTVESPQLGVTVAIGILVHNIPEGIAIAVPCIAARPDAPWLAFWLASVSGLAEPLGAVVALSVLQHSKLPLENVLAGVAGIMCTVSAVELYPEAMRHLVNNSYRSIVWGSLVGMIIMMATEWILP